MGSLAKTGAEIREWVVSAPLQPELERQIREAYARVAGDGDASFAVRSSATAEDLPDASFAGQQETFLNIRGIDNVLDAVKQVFASLYNDRAIAYRVHKGFAHADVALSAGVQRMVRSDTGAAGVVFTLDTESGFRDVVFVTASYGLGEMVVQGAVNPDEFYVSKPCLAAGQPGRSCAAAWAARRSRWSSPPRPRRTSRWCSATSSPPTATASASPTPTWSSSRATRWRSRSTTAARWTSSGARTAATGRSTSSRPAPRR